MQTAYATGNDFWTKIDAAADETFENRVKGSDMTALDTALAAGAVWSTPALKKLYELLNSYYQNDLSLSSPLLDAYLATVGWRVPYEAAAAYYEAIGRRLSEEYVFAVGTKPVETVAGIMDATPVGTGLHLIGTWDPTATWTAGTALSNCYSPLAIVSMVATPGGSGHQLTATLQDATTKDIAFTPHATQYGYVFLGSQAIGAAGAAAAQKVVPVAATAQFKAAEWVLLVDIGTYFSFVEVAQIDSIVTNTSLTMESNLINTYTENDLVLPLFVDATRKAGTIASEKQLKVYGYPDRLIAL